MGSIKRVGHLVWMVLSRAWRRSWAVVVSRSWKDLLRDGVLLVVALIVAYFAQQVLVRHHYLDTTDSLALDWIITVVIAAAIAVALFSALFIVEFLFVTPYIFLHEATKSAQVEPSPKLPATILELFHTDFGTLKQTVTFNLTVSGNPAPIGVIFDVCIEPDKRSEWYALYFPQTIHLVQVIGQTLGLLAAERARMHGVQITSMQPGDFEAFEAGDATFTGRVFVYFEGSLSHADIASLQALGLPIGYFLTFRGYSYWVDRMARDASKH